MLQLLVSIGLSDCPECTYDSDKKSLVVNKGTYLSSDFADYPDVVEITIQTEGTINRLTFTPFSGLESLKKITFSAKGFNRIDSYQNENMEVVLDLQETLYASLFIWYFDGRLTIKSKEIKLSYSDYPEPCKSLTLISDNPIKIDSYQFRLCKAPPEFHIISEGNVTIGWESFQNNTMELFEIQSGDSVIIEYGAFNEVVGLKSLSINAKSNIEFGRSSATFSEIGKINLVTDGSVKVSDNAFYNCSTLSELSIESKNDVVLGEYAFAHNSKLKTATINTTGALTIEGYSFAHCTSLEEPTISADSQTIDETAYKDTKFKGNGGNGPETGLIILIVVVVLVIVAIVSFCVYWFVFRKKSKMAPSSDTGAKTSSTSFQYQL